MATRRPAGLGSTGLQRARENIGHGQSTDHLEETLLPGDRPAQDLSTGWINADDSSRVEAFLYNYTNNILYVRWINNHTTWAYYDVTSALFEAFAAAPSKGKYVNSSLNLHSYGEVFL